jgi:hypothetical protein
MIKFLSSVNVETYATNIQMASAQNHQSSFLQKVQMRPVAKKVFYDVISKIVCQKSNGEGVTWVFPSSRDVSASSFYQKGDHAAQR